MSVRPTLGQQCESDPLKTNKINWPFLFQESSDGSGEPGPLSRPRANTITGNSNNCNDTSNVCSTSNSNNISNCYNSSTNNSNSITNSTATCNPSTAVWHLPQDSPPTPPKRLKKPSAVGLKKPADLATTGLQKSDSTVSSLSVTSYKSSASSSSGKSSSGNSSSGKSSSGNSSSGKSCSDHSSLASIASVRQYFLFGQMHMDFGASILRDRELHKIQTHSNYLQPAQSYRDSPEVCTGADSTTLPAVLWELGATDNNKRHGTLLYTSQLGESHFYTH